MAVRLALPLKSAHPLPMALMKAARASFRVVCTMKPGVLISLPFATFAVGFAFAVGFGEKAAGQTAWPRHKQTLVDFDGPVYGPGHGQQAPPIIPPAKGTRIVTPPPVATNWVVPSAKPVRYDTLELAIVGGSGTNRLATINNQTFKAGETFRVILGTNRVAVQCLEIRARMARVQVEGEEAPRLLHLPPWR